MSEVKELMKRIAELEQLVRQSDAQFQMLLDAVYAHQGKVMDSIERFKKEQ